MEHEFDRQLELGFGTAGKASQRGYEQWMEARRAALVALGRKLGLPMGQAVEVWLKSGIRLRGKLRLREEVLIVPEERDFRLELTVDGVPFKADEIEGCLRLK